MAALDPRIEAIRKEYGLSASDFWELPQRKGTWIAKHSALEVAAAKAGITFAAPIILEADGVAKSAALCVTGTFKDRSEWSVGEASPANNKNAYPFAMAEKRGKDRVILKLLGLNGLAYSEDEADDFKGSATSHEAPTPPPAPPPSPLPAPAPLSPEQWAHKAVTIILGANAEDLHTFTEKHYERIAKYRKPFPLLHAEIVKAIQVRNVELAG